MNSSPIFDSIFQAAQNSLQTSPNEEKTIKKESKNWNAVNYETENYSQELLSLLKKYQFSIDGYQKHTAVSLDIYEALLETYNCSFNHWKFTVRHYTSPDIEQGIFVLSEIEHQVTHEKIENFYCDLGCRNTGPEALDDFLFLLNFDSLKEFVKVRYAPYLALPELLKNIGYLVEPHDYYFTLNEPHGYLKIMDDVYVKIYQDFRKFQLVVTNDPDWNCNSDHRFSSHGEKAYTFDYNRVEDIAELHRCITLFIEHTKGKIGFYENERYYGNKDLLHFFDELKKFSKYNQNQVQIRTYDWSIDNEPKTTNKYEGLEIYVLTLLTFYPTEQWNSDTKINHSRIVFEFDTQKSPNHCHLLIENRIELANQNPVPFSTFTVNEYGSFTHLYKLLKKYVFRMFEIHSIPISNKE